MWDRICDLFTEDEDSCEMTGNINLYNLDKKYLINMIHILENDCKIWREIAEAATKQIAESKK